MAQIALLALFVLTFFPPSNAGGQSSQADVRAFEARLEELRKEEQHGGSDPSAVLFEQLAQADHLFFDALFARCDAERASALLVSDVEFYDDRTGLSVGEDLREDFRRLAENCPADHGVRRILLPETVEVHPIDGFGAVQTGVHHFVERGASTSTIGRFVHVWKRVGDGWKLARIISLHEVVDATLAAESKR